ncbi:MAG: class I SAM-dependent methyltransferase [Chloroflexi bacterium]|nr:class I SAM-dependent methyltransferase [Chloroflexota bacterium]
MFAPTYDLAMTPTDLLGLRRLRRRLLSKVPPGRVLEVGAGTGLNLPWYPAGVAAVITEPDHAMLRRARRRARRRELSLVAADAQALPFRDDAFDTVLATLVFCTVPDAARGLAELRRVLKPDGKLLLLEHVRMPQRPLAKLQGLLNPLWNRMAGGCNLDRDTLSTVTQAGFAVQSVRRHMMGWLLEIVAAKA